MARYLFLIVLAAAIAMTGCGKQEESTPAAPANGGNTVDDLTGAMQEMASSIDTQKYSSQLTAVESQLANLKKMAKDRADDELNKLIDQVGAKLEDAQEKLVSLKDAEGGTAQTLKQELDALMPELKKLLDQAMTKAEELGV